MTEHEVLDEREGSVRAIKRSLIAIAVFLGLIALTSWGVGLGCCGPKPPHPVKGGDCHKNSSCCLSN